MSAVAPTRAETGHVAGCDGGSTMLSSSKRMSGRSSTGALGTPLGPWPGGLKLVLSGTLMAKSSAKYRATTTLSAAIAAAITSAGVRKISVRVIKFTAPPICGEHVK